MLRRALLTSLGAGMVGAPAIAARTGTLPGVSPTEIRIGQTMPYSGPLSAAANIGHAEAAFFRMTNERGGVGGRKIRFISLDDGFSPPKTVEQTRKLVEQDGVAFIFGSLGTPTNLAIQRYLNRRNIPQLFIASGADQWGDYRKHKWTIAWQPSYRAEARIYAKYILAHKPDAKIGLLYRNDDFGKDYLLGVKDVLGNRFADRVVRSETYEATDPTVQSQIVALQSSGANTLIAGADPKFAAQTIREVYDIGWKPLLFLAYVSTSVGVVLQAAGLEKAVGAITASYIKDPTDPAWAKDAGVQQWRAFMQKYLPGADQTDSDYVIGYGSALTLLHVLQQCNGDFSRDNILRQATNLRALAIPVLLPGITVSTSPTDYHPIRRMQLARWSGRVWQRFGGLIEGDGV